MVDACWRVPGRRGVYAVGDVAAKPPAQQLGSFAHWEAEFVAAHLKATWRGRDRAAAAPYTPPPQLVNVSLGPRDGVFLYDGAILFTSLPAAALKAATQAWFTRLLPIPYALLRRLPRLLPAAEGAAGEAPPRTAAA